VDVRDAFFDQFSQCPVDVPSWQARLRTNGPAGRPASRAPSPIDEEVEARSPRGSLTKQAIKYSTLLV
jgi:hypothetical protein